MIQFTSSTYNCHYYYFDKRDNFIKVSNTACWAGVNPVSTYIKDPKDNFIYITHYRTKFTKLVDVQRMVDLINLITPCKIVQYKGKKYIKYELINNRHYRSNLVLLNFLRMLWYKPSGLNHDGFIASTRKFEGDYDPLFFLMNCVKENVIPLDKYTCYLGHSPVTPLIVPKSKYELFKFGGTTMEQFLVAKI